jgi:2-polyprenyl-3-methyl-5-hydroxy-6-metoxy-1,4-benzoquinol methylase
MTSLSSPTTFANLVEYTEPDLYDLENPDFAPDGAFYLALTQQYPGPVLDLGCGTGRITIPLARQGVPITGMDVMPPMLARAQAKAADLPITWVQADARAFQLSTHYRLIFDTGTTLQHLLERVDHEAVLARIREHLTPDGYAVFHTFAPHPTRLVDIAEHEWFTYAAEPGRTIRVSGSVRYDHPHQVFHEDAIRRWQDGTGQEVVRFAPLARRMFFPKEFELLLQYNGFTVMQQYGGWDGSPITNASQLIIIVCARAA